MVAFRRSCRYDESPVDLATYNAAPIIADFVNSNDLDDIVICYAARIETEKATPSQQTAKHSSTTIPEVSSLTN